MVRVLLLLASLLFTVDCKSQITVSGKVLNRDNNSPVAFANVGILGSNIGSISNEDGTFSLPVPSFNLKDSLTFSAVGFGKKRVPINYFLEGAEKVVFLNEKIYVLNEVLITQRREKNKIFEIGNRSYNGGVLEDDTTYSGRSIALYIDVMSQPELQFPAYIQKANLRILRNNLPSFRFRIRLNEVDSLTGEPGKDIFQKNIIVKSSMRNGWIEFDLSDLNHLIYRPFFVTFEQIVDLTDRIAIANGYRDYIHQHPDKLKIDTVIFSGKKEVIRTLKGGIDLPGTFIAIHNAKSDEYTCFERETSFGAWKKVRGIVAAYVTLSNQSVTNVNSTCESAPCKVTKMCQDFLDETGMNGLQLAVFKGNEKKISISMGWADVQRRLAVTDSTRFRINSISKSITATALIKLLEDGLLNLDAPVQKYLGEFPNIQQPFTTRQLAGHLAGTRDYNENDLSDFIRLQHYSTASEALEIIKYDTLLFKPGTKFHYSTFGWTIVGAVIEAVSYEKYGDFMSRRIIEALKLKNTCLDDVQTVVPNRSRFYDAAGNENEYGDWSYKFPGAGLLSTAEELARFGNELLNGNYFDQEKKSLLFRTQHTNDNKETGYGLGWYIGFDKRGNKIWYHSGDTFSSSSHLIIYPDHNIVISFLGNSQAGAAFDLQTIADIVLAEK